MKAKKLAMELLNYPEFEVVFRSLETDGSKWGIGLKSFDIVISDIGHSSKIIILSGGEPIV